MKTITAEALKGNLSSVLDEAASGKRILITRHAKPVAYLIGASNPCITTGSRFGKTRLKSVLKMGVQGRLRELLEEDRKDRFDKPA